MYIIIFVALLLIASVVCFNIANDNGKIKLRNAMPVVMVLLLIAFLVALVLAVCLGSTASYEAYNLEKGPNTVRLLALPDNEKRPDNQFVWSDYSLVGSLYYYYLPERLDGSQEIEQVSAGSFLVDRRSGEEPHLEVYYAKGFRDWWRYIYLIPGDVHFYVIVVPESEPIEETFSLE